MTLDTPPPTPCEGLKKAPFIAREEGGLNGGDRTLDIFCHPWRAVHFVVSLSYLSLPIALSVHPSVHPSVRPSVRPS